MSWAERLAIADALVGLYLIGSVSRQRRHKAAVLGVGVLLLMIAFWLLWVAWNASAVPRPTVPLPVTSTSPEPLV